MSKLSLPDQFLLRRIVELTDKLYESENITGEERADLYYIKKYAEQVLDTRGGVNE